MTSIEQTRLSPAWAAAIGLGVTGLVTMVAVLVYFEHFLDEDAILMLPAAIVGAAAMAAPFHKMYGRKGWRGWGLSAVGAAFATLLGSFAGGLIWAILVNYFLLSGGEELHVFKAAGFCTVIVLSSIATVWPVTVSWGIAMAFLHLMVSRVRSARKVHIYQDACTNAEDVAHGS